MNTYSRLVRVFAALAILVVPFLGPGCAKDPAVAVGETKVTITSEKIGRGREAKDGDIVCIDYRVLTEEDEELMWGRDFCFELGGGATIAGIDEICVGMKAGGHRRARCPSHMHWGTAGHGKKIPPRSLLVLDVKLTTIE